MDSFVTKRSREDVCVEDALENAKRHQKGTYAARTDEITKARTVLELLQVHPALG